MVHRAPRAVRRWRNIAAAAALSVSVTGCGLLSWSESPAPHHGSGRHGSAQRARAAGEYVVQRGDTLYSIAFRSQLDYHDIANWNGIGRDYAIHVGQTLRLSPPAGAEPPLSSSSSGISTRPLETPLPPVPGAIVPILPPPPDIAVAAWRWPTEGAVVQRFAPDDGAKGIDIAGQPGQIVVASAPGKVVYSGSALKGYGELIIIKHNEQYLSAYGYNRKRLAEEGQQVAAGQPIAELGLGPEQKPRLHFEIRDKGKPVDPTFLLPRR